MSYPGAGDVLHATTAHPDLQRRRDQTSRDGEHEPADIMSERTAEIESNHGRIKMRGNKSQGGGAQLASAAFTSLLIKPPAEVPHKPFDVPSAGCKHAFESVILS